MKTPAEFNIETAAEDFAGPGRRVECPVRLSGEEESGLSEHYFARRQMYIHVGEWTLSAVWGNGTYCTAGRRFLGGGRSHVAAPDSSPDAEVAAWKSEGRMIDLHGDSVEGWISPASLLAAVAAAERDDEEGIRAALVRSES